MNHAIPQRHGTVITDTTATSRPPVRKPARPKRLVASALSTSLPTSAAARGFLVHGR